MIGWCLQPTNSCSRSSAASTTGAVMAATTTRRKVLIAVDPSRQAEHAFDWYVTWLHRPENEVIILHVPEMELDAHKLKHVNKSVSAFEEAVKKEQLKTKELEEKFNEKIVKHSICGYIKSASGSKPGEVICKAAERDSVTMIVVGTRGLGSVRRTIMGSVSDYVVHHAHCPVAICRTAE